MTLFPQCDRALRDSMARGHWPGGMAFDAQHEELLARGWPHLCLLVDGDPRDRKPDKEAWKVLSAIDPPITVHWPRDMARRYVHAVAAAGMRRPAEKGTERFAAALARTDDPGLEQAQAVVRGSVATLSGYSFHWRNALFLLECFVGSEAMAEVVVQQLEALTPEQWAFDNLHNRFFETLFALECFLLRSDRATAGALAARVRATYDRRPPDAAQPLTAWRLAITLEGTPAYVAHEKAYAYNLPLLTIDEAFIPVYLEHEYASWLLDPQLLRVAGPGIVAPRMLTPMRRDGGYKQVERAVVFAPVRHAVIVELMAGMVGSKGAKGLPEAWLAAHLDFARPTLQRLVADGHPQASALGALAGGDAPAAATRAKKAAKGRKLTDAQLDAAVGKLFARIVADVRKVRGDAEAEARVWTEATHALVELRVAAGDAYPTERVGHAFGVDGWGVHEAPILALAASQDEMDRWFSAIDAASDT